jgi:hypothetical protein
MAGSISLSLSQQFDSTGAPLNGGLLYFYAAGTTTPQSAYQDYSLSLPWPNPMVLDSAGRIPAFYLADGQIKIRLTDSAGVVQVAADNLLVVGASAGTGTPPTVDATTILSAGDIKVKYGTGALSGFVRANGRTIGSGASGGTERANSDCQTLFEYLWAADANLSVSTGRGASAAADFAANKTITLPDYRGRAIAGLDDMGTSASGRLTTTYFGTSPIVLGAASTPTESKTILTANLPAYTPTGTITNGAITFPASVVTSVASGANAGITTGPSTTNASLTAVLVPIQATTTFAGAAQGGSSTPFSIIQPTILATVYLKL